MLIHVLERWCNKWRVLVNVQKTKMLHFWKTNVSETQTVLILNDEPIEKVDGYKYLGVYITYNLNMDVTIETLAKGGSRALGQVIGKTKGNYDLSYASFTKLFDIMVVAILDYAVGSWINLRSANQCKKLDNIQNRAICFFCGIPRSSPVSGFTGNMGWDPGVVRRDVETLCMYNQFIRMDSNCLCRQVFESEKTDMNMSSWAENVKSIMACTDNLPEWNAKMCVNLKLA